MQNKRNYRKRGKRKKSQMLEFSKLIIIQESLLIWISTLKLLHFASLSISQGYTGTLPYIATLCGAIWGAYGVSVAFYYNKAKAENLNKDKSTNVIQNIDEYEDMSKLKELEGL